MALWLYGFVASWLCGVAALWFCGVVVVFLRGFVRCGFMTLRLCGLVALWLCACRFCASRKSEILMFSQSLRREDFVKYGVAYYSTTAQLILENSYSGHFVATTTLSFVQTVQQPHLHTQITKINHMNTFSQFTYFTIHMLQLFRDETCCLSCMMRCMCVFNVSRCRVCSGNGYLSLQTKNGVNGSGGI